MIMINLEDKKAILEKFECQKTGNCCRESGYVYVTKDNIEKMSRLLNLSIETFREKYVTRHNGWDIIASDRHRPNCFLDKKNQCQVYDARPNHCRTYPNWPEIWESENTLIKETYLCPALKKAYFEFNQNKTEKTAKKSV
jgi:Fe-S-cluster containining protein